MAKIMLKQTSDFLNGKGIISVITRNHDVPWKNLVNPLDLDLDYYLNKSGSKIITPLLENFITNNGISDENMDRIASLCYTKYGLGWQRAWQALQEEYNAIHNYDGTETITETETIEDVNKYKYLIHCDSDDNVSMFFYSEEFDRYFKIYFYRNCSQ